MERVNSPENEVSRPELAFGNGEHLFNARYAAEFFEKHADVPRTMRFTEIRADQRFKNDPLILTTTAEFKAINAQWQIDKKAWALANPMNASMKQSHTDDETRKRQGRKEVQMTKRVQIDRYLPNVSDADFLRSTHSLMHKAMRDQARLADMCAAVFEHSIFIAKREKEAQRAIEHVTTKWTN